MTATAAILVLSAVGVLLAAVWRLQALVRYERRGERTAETVVRTLARDKNIPVSIGRAAGFLQEQCRVDSTPPTILLSESVAKSTSLAAIGMACHELGHAVQAQGGDVALQFRLAVAPLGALATLAVLPVAICFGLAPAATVFAAALLCGAIALPSEIDASVRAIGWMRELGLPTGEARAALGWAFATYLASPLIAPLQVVEYLLSGMRNLPANETVAAPGCLAAIGTWVRARGFWVSIVVAKVLATAWFFISRNSEGLADAMRILRSTIVQ